MPVIRARRRMRKPNLAKLIEQAKKAGATSVTTPEGYTMRFDEQAKPEGDDTLDHWMAKHARASERH